MLTFPSSSPGYPQKPSTGAPGPGLLALGPVSLSIARGATKEQKVEGLPLLPLVSRSPTHMQAFCIFQAVAQEPCSYYKPRGRYHLPMSSSGIAYSRSSPWEASRGLSGSLQVFL